MNLPHRHRPSVCSLIVAALSGYGYGQPACNATLPVHAPAQEDKQAPIGLPKSSNGIRVLNQRQKRKARRARYAAGDRRAFA